MLLRASAPRRQASAAGDRTLLTRSFIRYVTALAVAALVTGGLSLLLRQFTVTPTLLASATLIAAHRMLSVLAFRSDWFGTWINGHSRALIRDGEVDWDAMEKSHLSEKDLQATMRLAAHITDPSQVKTAHLERSGDVSVIPQEREPKIVELEIEDGVQVIRLELRK